MYHNRVLYFFTSLPPSMHVVITQAIEGKGRHMHSSRFPFQASLLLLILQFLANEKWRTGRTWEKLRPPFSQFLSWCKVCLYLREVLRKEGGKTKLCYDLQGCVCVHAHALYLWWPGLRFSFSIGICCNTSGNQFLELWFFKTADNFFALKWARRFYWARPSRTIVTWSWGETRSGFLIASIGKQKKTLLG